MKDNVNRIVVSVKKAWPYLVSLGGALVMVVAWFVPSIQDQYDRYQARVVIERFEELGDDFMKEEQFKMAEGAYAKAYELSDDKRLDIEVKRLNAKVSRVNVELEWGENIPEDLKEVDFQFLIHILKEKDQEKQRLAAMDCYGVFLAHSGRRREAREIFIQILKDNPKQPLTQMNLGNLLEREGRTDEAEVAYRKSVALDPQNGWAHYYLGRFLAAHGRLDEARAEMGEVIKLDPSDSEAVREYDSLARAMKKPA